MVTTASNSGCENKLAKALEGIIDKDAKAEVSLEHLSKGPAIVSLETKNLTVRFRMDPSEIRNLEGPAFEKRVRDKVADAYGAVT